MTSVSTIDLIEIDGSETIPGKKDQSLTVKNHWNRRELVVLVLPGGKEVTVSADELKKAIANAQNSHRY